MKRNRLLCLLLVPVLLLLAACSPADTGLSDHIAVVATLTLPNP